MKIFADREESTSADFRAENISELTNGRVAPKQNEYSNIVMKRPLNVCRFAATSSRTPPIKWDAARIHSVLRYWSANWPATSGEIMQASGSVA